MVLSAVVSFVTTYPVLSAVAAVLAYVYLPFGQYIEFAMWPFFLALRIGETVWLSTIGRLFAPKLTTLPKGQVKRVCVIGAGASGIAAAKEALRAGFDVTVYEQTDSIGGNWVFRENETHASVYRSTFINTSKQAMVYSDYPMPPHFPTYPSHEQIVRYFRDYAQHFGVTQRIRFRTQVLDVSLNPDGKRWDVSTVPSPDQKPLYLRAKEGGGQAALDALKRDAAVETFDAVMVSNGHHSVPRWPAFPGQSEFAGHIMHSHAYKDPTSGYDFRGKNVVVVGIGNSAVDIANELSHCVAKTVYLSTRSGARIWPKFIRGYAFDHYLNPPMWKGLCLPKFLRGNLPMLKLAMKPVEALIAEHLGDQSKFGIQPPAWLLGAHPTISEELLHRIGTGTITVVPDVRRIEKEHVVFTDGNRVRADVIVFATGYHISFPFLKPQYQPLRCNRVSTRTGQPEANANVHANANPSANADHKAGVDPADPLGGNGIDCYKAVFSPHLPWTLAHIGLFQPLGAIMPISEMQARWVVGAWAGSLGLPDAAEMQKDCDAFAKELAERYIARPRHSIQRDGFVYMDELAELIGCEPNLLDPRNWPYLKQLTLSPAGWPVAYRLNGPGQWEGARQALIENYNAIAGPKTHSARAGLDDEPASAAAAAAAAAGAAGDSKSDPNPRDGKSKRA